MSLLTLSNLSVRYGRLTAVRGVTFTMAEGEILFITGPNGAGKSSLLRAIWKSRACRLFERSEIIHVATAPVDSRSWVHRIHRDKLP